MYMHIYVFIYAYVLMMVRVRALKFQVLVSNLDVIVPVSQVHIRYKLGTH